MVSLEFWSQGFPYGTTHSPPSLAAFEKVFGSRTNIALHNCQDCATIIRHITHFVKLCRYVPSRNRERKNLRHRCRQSERVGDWV